MIDQDAIERGFSRKAAVYDAYGAGHPAIRWSRAQVRGWVERLAPPGARVLELNAGTGADAVYLAARGYRVHATDVAEGMLAEAERKRAAERLADRLTIQRCSFLALDQVAGAPYDLVLSNFGGLNCLPDLRPVAAQLPAVLAPGGHVVWVLMPPFCPWELAQALRGRFGVAFRRLRRATRAHVEGARFMTYYFTSADVARALGPRFTRVGQQSLGLVSPPSFMDGFPRRFPRLFQQLTEWDERLGGRAPFHGWGDFFVYAARYMP